MGFLILAGIVLVSLTIIVLVVWFKEHQARERQAEEECRQYREIVSTWPAPRVNTVQSFPGGSRPAPLTPSPRASIDTGVTDAVSDLAHRIILNDLLLNQPVGSDAEVHSSSCDSSYGGSYSGGESACDSSGGSSCGSSCGSCGD